MYIGLCYLLNNNSSKDNSFFKVMSFNKFQELLTFSFRIETEKLKQNGFYNIVNQCHLLKC